MVQQYRRAVNVFIMQKEISKGIREGEKIIKQKFLFF